MAPKREQPERLRVKPERLEVISFKRERPIGPSPAIRRCAARILLLAPTPLVHTALNIQHMHKGARTGGAGCRARRPGGRRPTMTPKDSTAHK